MDYAGLNHGIVKKLSYWIRAHMIIGAQFDRAQFDKGNSSPIFRTLYVLEASIPS